MVGKKKGMATPAKDYQINKWSQWVLILRGSLRGKRAGGEQKRNLRKKQRDSIVET